MFQRTTPISSVFDRFLAEAESDFPQTAGKLCLFDRESGHFYISPQFDLQAHGFEGMDAFAAYLDQHEAVMACRKNLSWAAAAFKDREQDILLICYNQSLTPVQRKSLDREDIVDITHFLDHELAHIVISAAYDTRHESPHDALLAENIAETYATLRSHQRFPGKEKNFVRDALALAAQVALETPKWKTHFFYPTLRALQNLKQQDIQDLSPAETAVRAEALARAHTPPQGTMEALLRATGKCRTAYKTGGLHAALPRLAEVAFAGKSDAITQLAIDACLYHLDLPANALNGSLWSKMRQDLKAFDMRLSGSQATQASKSTPQIRLPSILQLWRKK